MLEAICWLLVEADLILLNSHFFPYPVTLKKDNPLSGVIHIIHIMCILFTKFSIMIMFCLFHTLLFLKS